MGYKKGREMEQLTGAGLQLGRIEEAEKRSLIKDGELVGSLRRDTDRDDII